MIWSLTTFIGSVANWGDVTFMQAQCARCGRDIEATETRYTRRTPEAGAEHFCSLNCPADTDRYDEATVGAELFDAMPAE